MSTPRPSGEEANDSLDGAQSDGLSDHPSTVRPDNERRRLFGRKSIALTSLSSGTFQSHSDHGPRSLVPTSLSLHGSAIIRRLASRGLFSLLDHSKSTISNNPGLGRTLDNFVGAAGRRLEQVINNSAERMGRGPTAFTARFMSDVGESLHCSCRKRSRPRESSAEDVLAGIFGETETFFCASCEDAYFRSLYHACQVGTCERLIAFLRHNNPDINCLSITYITALICILPARLSIFLNLGLKVALKGALQRSLDDTSKVQALGYLAQADILIEAIDGLVDKADYLNDLLRTQITGPIPYIRFRNLCNPLIDDLRSSSPGYARSFLTFCVMASMRHVSRNESRLLEPFTQELVLFSLDCASRDPVFNTVARGHSWFIRKLYSNYDWVSHSDEVWDILWIPLLKQLAYPTSGTMTPVLVARFLNWANTMLGLLCPIDLSAEVQDELRRLWQVITRGEFVLAGENLASRTIAILPRVFAPLPQQERYVLCEETPKSLNHDLNYGHHDIGHYPDVDALDNIINSDYYIHVRTAHGTKVLDKPFLYLMTCPVPRGARDMVVRVECRRTHAFAVQSQLLPTQICYASIIRDSGESHGCWPILPYVLPLWQTLAVTVEEEHDLMKSLQPGDRIAIWIMPHTYVRTADVHLFTANSS